MNDDRPDAAATRAEPETTTPDAAAPARRSRLRQALRIVLLALGAIVAAILVVSLVPSSPGDLRSRPDPTTGYDDAVARFKAATADEPGKVFDPCRSRLLDHGARTAVAVVLIHGLTNCPRQFVELGEELQRAGANVVILRVPRHGLGSADGRSIGGVGNVGGLTQQELRDYADHAVDIGDGLGEHVRVLGLSMGGVIAAWIAQNRPDVERSVAVAPALTIPVGPPFLNTMFRNAVSRLPNITVPGAATLDHAYEGSSTRALAAMYQLSESVRSAAARTAPVVSSIAVVTNATDDQVNNTDIRSLADAWQRHGATVRRYDFPKALGLPHDLIDVQQPRHRGDLVDHVLLDLLGFGP